MTDVLIGEPGDPSEIALMRASLGGHPRNRMRPPGWRWLQAHAIRELGLRPGRLDDGWVRRAYRFGGTLIRHGDDPGHARVVKADGLLAAVVEIHRGDPRRRAELEARLLSGQDTAGITARTLLPPDVVEAYATLFYDVGGRLECSDWIAAFCFGPRAYRSYTAADFDIVWKVVAYRMGPLALDLALDACYGGSASGIRDERNGPETEAGLAIRSYINAMTLPLDDAGAVKVLRLLDLEERLEAEKVGRGAGFASAPLIVGNRAVEAAVLASAAIDRGNDVEADGPRPVDEGRDEDHDEADIDLLDSRSA